MRIFVEPGLALPIIWHEGLESVPEPGRMVFLLDVEKFVGHYVIDEGVFGHDELPVEGKAVVRRTGTPLSSRSHKPDALRYQIEPFAEIEYLLRDFFPGFCFIPPDEKIPGPCNVGPV